MSALAAVVNDYLGHVRVERGLAANTVAAYRRDLARYVAFLEERGILELSEVTLVELSEFVRELSAQVAKASVARTVVSVRNLHGFAHEEGVTPDNPALDLHPPKLDQRLPKALSIAEVQALLDAPDTDEVTGLRDAALLELLYGTGARISEICALDVDDLTAILKDPDAGLRLLGKGGKERLVPLGSYARAAVDAYLVRARPVLAVQIGRAHV